MRPISAATSTLSAAFLRAAASQTSRCHNGGAYFATFSFLKDRQRQQQQGRLSSALSLHPEEHHALLPLPDAPPISEGDDVTTTLSASDIQDAFIKSNIDKVAFIRHGNTASAPVDFDRELTDLGRSQARAAGASYGVEELYPYHKRVALCSSAPRCVETANLFLASSIKSLEDRSGNDVDVSNMPPLRLCPQLYDGTMQPEGSRLFRAIGYAPLRRYLESPHEGDADAARCVLGEYAQASLDAIWDVVARDQTNEIREDKNNASQSKTSCAGQTLLFFAHAIYLPSAALVFASAVGCESNDNAGNRGDIDLILDTNTKEAEGYCVHIDTQSVSLLHRPEINND